MVKPPTPPAGACPPGLNASNDDITACATWIRKSNIVVPHTNFKVTSLADYYVYEVMDSHGNAIEPFYSAYLKHANAVAKPLSDAQAGDYSMKITTSAMPESSIVGGENVAAAAIAKYGIEIYKPHEYGKTAFERAP